MPDALDSLLIAELTTPVPSEVAAFAESLALALPVAPLGLLFYGSTLREPDPEGILDFYVIVETAADFTGGFLSRLGNRLLPPNVRYAEFKVGGTTWRAKIATLSLSQFRKRAKLRTRDTTIWARFCQPVRLVWVRDPEAADHLLESIARCAVTAACWAALLGPDAAPPVTFWEDLFRRTYAAELRVESKSRSQTLIAGREERFSKLLPLAWARAGLAFASTGGTLSPALSQRMRATAQRRWERVALTGKPRNIARLLKAAFTFQNGAAYLSWKILRHTGFDMALSSREVRHPILSLPMLLWRARAIRRGQSR